jgi:serine phosphatase RsbU (regulator of sigma subunit)
MKADVVARKKGLESALDIQQLELSSERQLKYKSKKTKAEMRRDRRIKARRFHRLHSKRARQKAKHLVALARASV